MPFFVVLNEAALAYFIALKFGVDEFLVYHHLSFVV